MRHQLAVLERQLGKADPALLAALRHLPHALREFEGFYNGHKPRQVIANAAPLHPLPEPITDPQQITACTYVVTNAWAESSTSTRMPHDLHG